MDFWVYYHHANRTLDVHLDWWSLQRLADFAPSSAMTASPLEALSGEAPLDVRLQAIGSLLAEAFAEAALPAHG